MAYGDAREGKWKGNWRMEWAASTLKLPRNVVYPTLLKLMRTPLQPAVDWTDAPADLNGLVRFGERRNLVSARVPSHLKRTIHTAKHGAVSEAGTQKSNKDRTTGVCRNADKCVLNRAEEQSRRGARNTKSSYWGSTRKFCDGKKIASR